MIYDLLTYFFSFIAVLTAIYILFSRNILYNAFALVSCLMSLAGIYVLLNAEFVAVTQIMVYVGGIIVLLLFAIFLTHKIQGKALLTSNYNRLAALIIIILTFPGLLWGLQDLSIMNIVPEVGDKGMAVRDLGILLMTRYLIPMEVVALLLLIVLIGASTVAANFYDRNG